MVDRDLAVAKVALRVARAHYSMLVRMQDILCCYQNNCSVFLEWQMAQGILEDLGELRDVGLPSDNNNLPLA